MLIKIIIAFIPSTTRIILIKFLVMVLLLNSSWFNTGICINNTLFILYSTAERRYVTRFHYLYITPRTLSCTNTKNIWCNYTCYKNKNLGARKYIFLMPQIAITISDDRIHPNTSPFSTHHLIWLKYKGVSQIFQLIYMVFSYLNSVWHFSVIKLCYE